MEMQLHSLEQTQQFGKIVGRYLEGGDVVALMGELGTGKTALTQSIALGLGIPSSQVSSPTFTLLQIYDGNPKLVHVDLYRLEESTSALAELGLHEYFMGDCIVVIEWANRLAQALPPDHLRIQLSHGKTEHDRYVKLEGTGRRSAHVVHILCRGWKEHPPA